MRLLMFLAVEVCMLYHNVHGIMPLEKKEKIVRGAVFPLCLQTYYEKLNKTHSRKIGQMNIHALNRSNKHGVLKMYFHSV